MTRRVTLALGLAVVGIVAAACSNDKPAASSTPNADAVTIQGFLFHPESLSVKAGTTVIWTNHDDIAHTITSGVPGHPTADFASGDKTLGQAFTHAFPTPGTFTYFCSNHNSMRGEVKVT